MSRTEITLRDAAPEDIEKLAELHVRAFDQAHGPGPDVSLRERQWREKLSSPDALLFCIVLEEPDRSLIGFASGKLHRSDDPVLSAECWTRSTCFGNITAKV